MAEGSKKEQPSQRLSNEKMNQITKESICRAMLLLLKEKDFQDISITELTRRAAVSRNGFYRNYSSKEEILEELISTFNKGLFIAVGIPTAGPELQEWYRRFFAIVRSQSGTMLRLINAGAQGQYLQATAKHFLKGCGSDSPEERYRVLAWNGALQSITQSWLNSGMSESDEKMALICSGLLSSF